VKFIYRVTFYNGMITGKMTATWLIILTMIGILVVPMVIIWFTTVHPYLVTHPKLLLGVVDFLPGVPIMNVIGGIFI
jgi:hypothetical protein